jgi:CMP-N-acetylneuraminic acid synthetase
MAAKNSKHVNDIFLSTEDERIKAVGRENGLKIIDRPAHLSTHSALVEDVIQHGFEAMSQHHKDIEMFVLLFCNTATITPGIIDKGIEQLRKDESYDSAVTVSLYNEYSPVRAKQVTKDNIILPYVDINSIPNASCDRDTAEPCYFCDCSVWIMRPRCLDYSKGIQPFRWMGQKSFPLHQSGGLDIDHDYGVALTEHWLRKNGFTETSTPYDGKSLASK